MTRRALIFGITGQSGSYLAELLLAKGYEVHGVVRRCSVINTPRIDHLYQDPRTPGCRLFLHYGDVTDAMSVRSILDKTTPHEVYNLAAQSHVGVSFEVPSYTNETVCVGALNILENIRSMGSGARYYQASSSEMFGAAPAPQSEITPFQPLSPYAVAKVAAYYQTICYRNAYGIHASNGVLFNHESPRRGETFVTRKITMAAARISAGLQDKLYLGNLSAKRDWGFAGDYVRAMWLMLQQDEPGDYVVATGEMHTVREWLNAVFAFHGLDVNEHVVIHDRHFRPNDVPELCGDASKARLELMWEPRVDFTGLIQMMAHADKKLVEKETCVC